MTIISLYPVACDLLDLFKSIHENLASLLENFFDLDIQNASRARDIYALYTLQVPRVQDYLEIAKEQFRYVIMDYHVCHQRYCRTRGIPLSSDLKYHPLDLLDDMDDYIARKNGEKVRDVQEPKIENEVAAPSPSEKEEIPKKEEKQVERDLILGNDEDTLIEVEKSQDSNGKFGVDFFADFSSSNNDKTIAASSNVSGRNRKGRDEQSIQGKEVNPLSIQPNWAKPSYPSGTVPHIQIANSLVAKTSSQDIPTSSQISVSKVLQESLEKSKGGVKKDAPADGSKEREVVHNDANYSKGTSGTVVPYNNVSFSETLSEFFDKRVIESKKIEVKVTGKPCFYSV